MEYQKILNLLDEANDSKFIISNWNIVNDQSNANYDVAKKLSIIQKLENKIFFITMVLTFSKR